MKLDDFEYYAEEKVLERGQKLFKDSKVRYKDKFGANWYFDVQGSKIYHIVICVNKNNVSEVYLSLSVGHTCPTINFVLISNIYREY